MDVQGDVTEHIACIDRAADSLGLKVTVSAVRDAESIKSLSALIIPGGESTTVGRLMSYYGLDEAVVDAASEVPVFGTCAGMVLLAKQGGNLKGGQRLLGLVDARVVRNAYGRQRESFEAELDINVLDGGGFPGVFIRAPALDDIWGGCVSLCEYDGKVVLAKQGNVLVASFHPELTDDTRLHEYFLGMI